MTTKDLPLEEADDRVLVQRHLDGDPDAFDELFRRYRDPMWSVAVGVCGDHEVAAEAVQEGFVSAFRRARSYRGDATVGIWLHRVVVRACSDAGRRSPEQPTAGSDARRRSPDAARHMDAHQRAHAALDGLPEEQRVPLVLTDVQRMPTAAAAEVLQIPTGAVESRCSRGREAVARSLHEAGVDLPGTSGPTPTSDNGGDRRAKGGEG